MDFTLSWRLAMSHALKSAFFVERLCAHYTRNRLVACLVKPATAFWEQLFPGPTKVKSIVGPVQWPSSA